MLTAIDPDSGTLWEHVLESATAPVSASDKVITFVAGWETLRSPRPTVTSSNAVRNEFRWLFSLTEPGSFPPGTPTSTSWPSLSSTVLRLTDKD